MRAQYAQDKPLSLTASLTFEQSYQGIEGDSASSAELYAILSSLSEYLFIRELPLPVLSTRMVRYSRWEGVNQKIEGSTGLVRHSD